jgi:hypothetical protein
MRLFYGLIIVFISAYIMEETKQFITDIVVLSIDKSITNYFRKYNRGYFRSLNRKSIAGFITI